MTPGDILDFWFKETPPERHFSVDPVFDFEIRTRFENAWKSALNGDFASWSGTAQFSIALIILCDQFPRNMFRGTANAFATDAIARDVAKTAIARRFDIETPQHVRPFFYLPLMHSENLADQDECIRLTRERLGENHSTLAFALRHRDAIARFGRFPARNIALGRISTPEELAFLKTNPSGF